MHLSLLSDVYLSDSLNDAADAPPATAAVAHRDGLLRGLAVMGVAGVLLGLTALSTTFHSAEADTARCGAVERQSQAEQADVPAQAAVWWEANDPTNQTADDVRRSTSLAQPGTSVTLVALRQRYRSACR